MCVSHTSLYTEYCVASEPVNITFYFHGQSSEYRILFLLSRPIRIAKISPSYNNMCYYLFHCILLIYPLQNVQFLTICIVKSVYFSILSPVAPPPMLPLVELSQCSVLCQSNYAIYTKNKLVFRDLFIF